MHDQQNAARPGKIKGIVRARDESELLSGGKEGRPLFGFEQHEYVDVFGQTGTPQN